MIPRDATMEAKRMLTHEWESGKNKAEAPQKVYNFLAKMLIGF